MEATKAILAQGFIEMSDEDTMVASGGVNWGHFAGGVTEMILGGGTCAFFPETFPVTAPIYAHGFSQAVSACFE